MPDSIPVWLATMREITGTLEEDGSADNPVILSWADEIARRFPEMRSYCAQYNHDSIPWCGLTVAYCMAHCGIRPVFGATDTDKFLWARAWSQFGTSVSHPQAGDVIVFQGHVSLFESEEGESYICRGGNQSDSVKLSHYLKSGVVSIRRPDATAVAQPDRPAVPIAVESRRFSAITATVFGGAGDPNTSAYDEHSINDDELGVALPARFTGARPKVRIFNGSRAVECEIVDVGPWNTNDKYWETGTRPQAESGIDRMGRTTNRAGIDLTPAAARTIGISGKGLVDWEFVGGPSPKAVPVGPVVSADVPPVLDLRLAKIEETLKSLMGRLQSVISPTPAPAPTPTPIAAPKPTGDAILQQVLQLLAALKPGDAGATGDKAPTDAERIRKALEIVAAIAGGSKPDQPAPLGPVNGALGQTIGNLLDGKKSAIGIIGSLVTALLANVPAGSGLGQLITTITPAAGLSPFALPAFLALSAWGVLGKLEKWSQANASAPRPPQ
jgi:uncharacterized protein (TIGR02594 family)